MENIATTIPTMTASIAFPIKTPMAVKKMWLSPSIMGLPPKTLGPSPADTGRTK